MKTKIKKSELRSREPLLSTVARKIGRAAGTVSKMTQDLTETFSALPRAVTAKMHDAANADGSTKRRRSHGRAKKGASTSRKRNVKKNLNKPSPAARKLRGRRSKPAGTSD